MPEFDIVAGFDVTPEEFLDSCSSEELLELISLMKNRGIIK